ncbi:hypothetical protein [Streptomyces sp. NPDC054887]
MKTTPKDKPGRPSAGARLARELAGLLLVAAGTLGLVRAAYAIHPLVGAGLVAVVLLGFACWTLHQRPRPSRTALGVGTFCAVAGLTLALAAIWTLSPVGGFAAFSVAAVGAGLWLTSGEAR